MRPEFWPSAFDSGRIVLFEPKIMTTIHIARGSNGFRVTFRGGNFSLCVSTLKSFIPAGLRGYTPATRKWFIDEDATDQMRRWPGM
jgi:hypothetical protein